MVAEIKLLLKGLLGSWGLVLGKVLMRLDLFCMLVSINFYIAVTDFCNRVFNCD